MKFSARTFLSLSVVLENTENPNGVGITDHLCKHVSLSFRCGVDAMKTMLVSYPYSVINQHGFYKIIQEYLGVGLGGFLQHGMRQYYLKLYTLVSYEHI